MEGFPLPPLENLKHEKFARVYPEVMTASGAYKSAYPNVAPQTAETSGPELLRNPQVKNRIVEILEQKCGLTDNYIGERLFDHVSNQGDGHLSHKALRTVLELKGYLNKEQSQAIAHVVFNAMVTTPVPSDNPGAVAQGDSTQVVDTNGDKLA